MKGEIQMKLIPVDSMPRKRRKGRLQSIIEEFYAMDANIVELVGFVESYSNIRSAYSSLFSGCMKSGYPVRAYLCGEKIYLKKIK